ECSHGRKPGVRLSEDAEPRKGRKTLRRVFRPYGAEFNTNTNPGLAPGATFLSRSAAMSGANASPTGRSHQEMTGANASPIGRSRQEMTGANASPTRSASAIARSHPKMKQLLFVIAAVLVTSSWAAAQSISTIVVNAPKVIITAGERMKLRV